MEELERLRRNSMQNTKIPYWLIIKRYWVGLLATPTSWFPCDFIVCPMYLLQLPHFRFDANLLLSPRLVCTLRLL